MLFPKKTKNSLKNFSCVYLPAIIFSEVSYQVGQQYISTNGKTNNETLLFYIWNLNIFTDNKKNLSLLHVESAYKSISKLRKWLLHRYVRIYGYNKNQLSNWVRFKIMKSKCFESVLLKKLLFSLVHFSIVHVLQQILVHDRGIAKLHLFH